MNTPTYPPTKARLEKGVIAFFIFAALLLLLVYFADPAIYAGSLSLTTSSSDRYPLLVTLFLFAILAFLTVLTIGVVRHWRWLFWLMLVAFTASVIQIPVLLLTIAGVIPSTDPHWYSLLRVATGVYELVLAIWMIRVYRRQGIWGLGKKNSSSSTAPLA